MFFLFITNSVFKQKNTCIPAFPLQTTSGIVDMTKISYLWSLLSDLVTCYGRCKKGKSFMHTDAQAKMSKEDKFTVGIRVEKVKLSK